MKNYGKFLLSQGIDIWLWYTAVVALFGISQTMYSSEEIFSLYIVSLLATIVALFIVSRQKTGMHDRKSIIQRLRATMFTLSRKDRASLAFLLFEGILLTAFLFYIDAFEGSLQAFVPDMSLGAVVIIFISKLFFLFVGYSQTDAHLQRTRSAVSAGLQMFAMVIAFVIWAYLHDELQVQWVDSLKGAFVVLVIPVSIFFQFGIFLYEKNGGNYKRS